MSAGFCPVLCYVWQANHMLPPPARNSKVFRAATKVPGTLHTLTAFALPVGTSTREVGMRSVLLTTISLLAFTATAAVAADLPRQMPARAPAYVPVGYNWTGFYLGVNGGYAWGRSHWDNFGGGSDPQGGMVGGTAGYNWQAMGSPWVVGLE